MSATPVTGHDWWRRAVCYQVYPLSFQDSNSDGRGDLAGIIDRLDYLNDGTEASLGIDCIWLSPVFPSPMRDFGYDVADYCGIHEWFGSPADMDRLIAECHRRGIRVLLDFVPNHTSDQHPWFRESRQSRTNPRRDWYVWRDGRDDGSPPNNWLSIFGGPAWQRDPATGQWYLHSFLLEQPDLNWRNRDVVAAMKDVLRFWLRRGVDGFRIDVMGMVVKDPALQDNPPNPSWDGIHEINSQLWVHNRNHPDVFQVVREIRGVLDEFPGAMAVGETFGTDEELGAFTGGSRLDGLHLAFNFNFIETGEFATTPWTGEVMYGIVTSIEAALSPGSQPAWAFGNHDRMRFISRHDHDGRGLDRARAAALLLLGLRGTPFLYYGDEIGMCDVSVDAAAAQDPARLRYRGRDPQRTPMQWDDSPTRGFSTGEPWLPYGPEAINVAAQRADPSSLLSLYRRASWTRRGERALHSGDFEALGRPGPVFAFIRAHNASPRILVAVNTAVDGTSISIPPGGWTVLLTSTTEDTPRVEAGELHIPGLGAVWLRDSEGTVRSERWPE